MSLAKNASLRQIIAFRTVARLGSVSFAAEELHLSQSAVSIQISQLEAAAGTALVSRTGRGVRLTDAGQLLLVYADRLVALWHETSDEIASLRGDFAGTLRIGSVTTADHWLPRLLVRFGHEHPKVKVKLWVANRDEVVRALAAREVDLAVMGRPPGELNVESLTIGSNPLAFVCAPTHPLMRVRPLTLARVAEVPLLIRERGSGTRTSVEARFKQAGLRLHIGSELSSNEAIKQMCVAGFGPAYVSLLTCALELDAGLLKVLPMADNPTAGAWHVARLAGQTPPKVAVAFEQFLSAHGPTEILAPIRQHLVKASRRRTASDAETVA